MPAWIPIAVLATLLVVAAGSLLFSTFMLYDDEGYVLFSLKTFAEGGGLYERVYSQYGPFFFLFNQVLHFGGLDFTNIGGRLLTLFCWLAAAGFSAAAVFRVTRSAAATVFTMGGVFLHLWPMISEPSHPGGLIVFATAAMGWCGVHWSAQPRKLAVASGLIGGALLLTKINVGVFLIAGVGAWWLLHATFSFPSTRVRNSLIVVALTLLPAALMRSQFHQSWVVIFALVAGAAGAGTALAAARGATPITRWVDLPWFAGAFCAIVGLTCAGVLAQGTSWHGLLDGVVLGPLRHPQAYTAYVRWRDGTLWLAFGSLAFAVWAVTRPSLTTLRVVAVGRLIVVGVFYVVLSLTLPLNTHAFAMSFALSSIWWFVFPLGGDQASQPARAWLALLLVPQALHAFPVAGSQISWGTFLWIPLAAIGVSDATRLLAPLAAPRYRQRLVTSFAAMLILTLIANCGYYAWLGVKRIRTSDSLGLPGASLIRVPESFSTTLRVLAQNASAHADLLFSLPGLHSFHLWTDVPPPTTMNATHWFTLLPLKEQEAIRTRLEAAPRACLIVQRNVYDFLVRSGIATESPLTVWLKANYEPAFTIETYEFWVRKGRAIAKLGTATVREGEAGTQPRYQVSVVLAATALTNVASIDLIRFDGDTTVKIRSWDAKDTALTITPLNSAGQAAGAPRPVTFPFSASGLMRIDLFTDQFPTPFPVGFGALDLRDADGQRLAEARFLP